MRDGRKQRQERQEYDRKEERMRRYIEEKVDRTMKDIYHMEGGQIEREEEDRQKEEVEETEKQRRRREKRE